MKQKSMLVSNGPPQNGILVPKRKPPQKTEFRVLNGVVKKRRLQLSKEGKFNKSLMKRLDLSHVVISESEFYQLPFAYWFQPWKQPMRRSDPTQPVHPSVESSSLRKSRAKNAMLRMKEVLDNDSLILRNVGNAPRELAHLPNVLVEMMSEYSIWPGSLVKMGRSLAVYRVVPVSGSVPGVSSYIAISKKDAKSGKARIIHMLPKQAALGALFRCYCLERGNHPQRDALKFARSNSEIATGVGSSELPRIFMDMYSACFAPVMGFTPKLFDLCNPNARAPRRFVRNVVAVAGRFIARVNLKTEEIATTFPPTPMRDWVPEAFALLAVMLAALDPCRIVHMDLQAVIGPEDTSASVSQMAYAIVGDFTGETEADDPWHKHLANAMRIMARVDDWREVGNDYVLPGVKWVQSVLKYGVADLCDKQSIAIRLERSKNRQNRQSMYYHYVPFEHIQASEKDIDWTIAYGLRTHRDEAFALPFTVANIISQVNDKVVKRRATEFMASMCAEWTSGTCLPLPGSLSAFAFRGVTAFKFHGVPYNRLQMTLQLLETELINERSPLKGQPTCPLVLEASKEPRGDGLRIPAAAFPVVGGSLLIFKKSHEPLIRAWMLYLHERHNGRRNSSLVSKTPIVTSMLVRGMFFPESVDPWEFVIAVRLLGCWFESNDHSRLKRNTGPCKAEYVPVYRNVLALIITIFNSTEAVEDQWETLLHQTEGIRQDKRREKYGVLVPMMECLRVVVFGNAVKQIVNGAYAVMLRWIVSEEASWMWRERLDVDSYPEYCNYFVRALAEHSVEAAKSCNGFTNTAKLSKVQLPGNHKFVEAFLYFLGDERVPQLLRAYLLLNTQLAACHLEQQRRGERHKEDVLDVCYKQHPHIWTTHEEWKQAIDTGRGHGISMGFESKRVMVLDDVDSSEEEDSLPAPTNLLYSLEELNKLRPVIFTKSTRNVGRLFVTSDADEATRGPLLSNTRTGHAASLRDQVCRLGDSNKASASKRKQMQKEARENREIKAKLKTKAGNYRRKAGCKVIAADVAMMMAKFFASEEDSESQDSELEDESMCTSEPSDDDEVIFVKEVTGQESEGSSVEASGSSQGVSGVSGVSERNSNSNSNSEQSEEVEIQDIPEGATLTEVREALIEMLPPKWTKTTWDHPDGRDMLQTNEQFNLDTLELVLNEGAYVEKAREFFDGVLHNNKVGHQSRLAVTAMIGLICKMCEQAGVAKGRDKPLIASMMLDPIGILGQQMLHVIGHEPPFYKYPARIEYNDWLSESMRIRKAPYPFEPNHAGVGTYSNTFGDQLPVISFHAIHERNYGANLASCLVADVADFFSVGLVSATDADA